MLEETQLSLKDIGDDVKKYVYIIRRRRWLIMAVMLLCMVGTFAYHSSKPPVYEAEALLVMDPDAGETMNLERRDPVRWDEELLTTQIAMVRSHSVLGEAYKLLELDQEGDDDGLERFLKRVSVKAVRMTRAFKITVRHQNPAEAVRQTNTLVDCYLHFNLDNRREILSDAFLSLSEQLQVMERKVESSETALLKYKVEEHIVSLEKRRVQLEQEVATKSAAFAEVDNRIKYLDATLAGIESTREGTSVSLPVHLRHAAIEETQHELNEALVDFADAAERFKAKHPRMMALESRIESLREQLNRETTKVVVGLETDRNIKRTEAAALAASLEQLKRMSMVVSKQAVQHGVLEREAKSNRKLYNTLLDRLKEADVEGNTRANNVRVIDHARLPLEPLATSKKAILVMGLIMGLLLSGASCFLMEIFDDALMHSSDVVYYFNQEPFATIPLYKGSLKHARPGVNDAFSLAFRAFRVILEKHRRSGIRTVMLTSSVKGEGKTTVLEHLGKTIADWGLSVLMIDADLINPDLSRGFNQHEKRGISDHLDHDVPLEELIIPLETENLYLLTAGLERGRPFELLGSNALGQLLAEVKEFYDIVLVDSPPINEVPEVPVLGAQVDGVLVIARDEKTHRRQMTEALRSLETFHAELLGIVLNGIKHFPKTTRQVEASAEETANSL